MMKIGLRLPGAVRNIPFADFVKWCKETGFEAIDLGGADSVRIQTIREQGLLLGTIDLPGTIDLLSSDETKRSAGITAGIAAIDAIADNGGDKAFCVFFPSDAHQSRKASFENWKASFPQVIAHAETRNVRVAVEGWPGPNNSALGVTPETLRAMFAEVPSAHFGINYDPSHLVRVGVDYKRFLAEFVSRVIHVHGKDAVTDAEGQYLYGNIGTTFARSVDFGEGDWRYTIPGEGASDWKYITSQLAAAKYDGIISIELEDFRYNGSLEGEKLGLSRSRHNLLHLL